MDRFINFFSSLRLTVVCLGLALVLVFAGTMAQVQLGLYAVQSRFFHSFFVYWTPAGGRFRVPVWPGGWAIGWLLMVNLLCAHLRRFGLKWKKAGILMVHAGLILLLAGQFLSEIFQVESQMRLEEGTSKNYLEDTRRNELAVIDITAKDHDVVVSIPQSLLERGGDIQAPGLPFVLRVKRFLPNSAPAGPMSGEGEKLRAANGTGRRLFFSPVPPVTRMNDENKPAALVEVATDRGVAGTWTVSTWLTKHPWVAVLQEQVGEMLKIAVNEPQTFAVGDRTFALALRPVRYYQPFSIKLIQFKHDIYPGTDIPRNFASKVHLSDPARGEDRDVLIYMNSPLRYRGLSFYQASFEAGDRVSILEVVRNPASVAPYVACGLTGFGLAVEFLTHLSGFAKRRARGVDSGRKAARPAGMPGPLAAGAGGEL